MNFITAVPKLTDAFDREGLRYALIGGLAMALRGVQRTTLDADFILLSDDLDRADGILNSLGYQREFQSENISHYQSKDSDLGRVDLLHAFRSATLGMLDRAERMSFTSTCQIPVVHTEDLIGLKVQAANNDPARFDSDWADIRRLISHCGETSQAIDWELVGDYLALFEQTDRLDELQKLHGTSSTN